VAFARLQPRLDQLETAMEVDETDVGHALREQTPVLLFEGGAGDHGRFVVLAQLDNQLVQALQPGQAIFVVQRLASGHFGDVLRRMKVVSVEKGIIQAPRQGATDGRLTGTGDAGEDDNPSHFLAASAKRCRSFSARCRETSSMQAKTAAPRK
jgi:hypothetical protein